MSWNYQTKHSGGLTYQDKSGALAYILTDNSDYVLLGENEDQRLVWSDPALSLNFETKHSGSWSYQSKS
jgi:hypothetical protein